jgi:hypothetical protein
VDLSVDGNLEIIEDSINMWSDKEWELIWIYLFICFFPEIFNTSVLCIIFH